MPLPLESAATIIDCLEYYAAIRADEDAYVFIVDGDGKEVRLTYKELRGRARLLARELVRHELEGETLLLLFPAGLDFIVAFFACLYAGAIAVPANLARGSHHFIRLGSIMRDSACRAVLTMPGLRDATMDGLSTAGMDVNDIVILSESAAAGNLPVDGQAAAIDSQAIAFIQYTSGSTGSPKGVVVTHSQLMANERAIQRSSAMPEFMTGAGWLPQFHDMGLIGNLLQPLALGGTYVFMSPLHFIQHPPRWLHMLSRYRAFASAAPCFALDMCVKAMASRKDKGKDDRVEEDWDLSGLDTIFCGAEPVSQSSLERFNACFAPYGLSPDAVKPCYGMAETTLIISGGLPRHADRVRNLDREALKRGEVRDWNPEEGRQRADQPIICCGETVDDHIIHVVCPESGKVLGDNTVGEIWCAGPSIAAGYWQKPEATREVFGAYTACGQGPFLRTGDLGFHDRGGVYITGRIKEMMIIRGRNHYPHDLEATVSAALADHHLDVRVAVFMDEDSEDVIAYVELPRRLKDPAVTNLTRAAAYAREAVSRVHDIRLKDTLLLRQGSIPRTSSGKIQRRLCAQLYRSGAIQARLTGNPKRGITA